jgi:DNA-binding beta-propeller fold protein YncE
MGTMYIVDFGNDRILRWFKDATSGMVIIGQDGTRNKASQLSDPYDIAFDREGNLYVADTSNHRIQMFRIDKSSCTMSKLMRQTDSPGNDDELLI